MTSRFGNVTGNLPSGWWCLIDRRIDRLIRVTNFAGCLWVFQTTTTTTTTKTIKTHVFQVSFLNCHLFFFSHFFVWDGLSLSFFKVFFWCYQDISLVEPGWKKRILCQSLLTDPNPNSPANSEAAKLWWGKPNPGKTRWNTGWPNGGGGRKNGWNTGGQKWGGRFSRREIFSGKFRGFGVSEGVKVC